jgi:hypothetical protein
MLWSSFVSEAFASLWRRFMGGRFGPVVSLVAVFQCDSCLGQFVLFYVAGFSYNSFSGDGDEYVVDSRHIGHACKVIA